MYRKTAIEHFGTVTAAAKALGITKSAVSQWPKVIPLGRAYQIQAVTDGLLTVDPAVYQRSKRRVHRIS